MKTALDLLIERIEGRITSLNEAYQDAERETEGFKCSMNQLNFALGQASELKMYEDQYIKGAIKKVSGFISGLIGLRSRLIRDKELVDKDDNFVKEVCEYLDTKIEADEFAKNTELEIVGKLIIKLENK